MMVEAPVYPIARNERFHHRNLKGNSWGALYRYGPRGALLESVGVPAFAIGGGDPDGLRS
jgi:hypothetical protein